MRILRHALDLVHRAGAPQRRLAQARGVLRTYNFNNKQLFTY